MDTVMLIPDQEVEEFDDTQFSVENEKNQQNASKPQHLTRSLIEEISFDKASHLGGDNCTGFTSNKSKYL